MRKTFLFVLSSLLFIGVGCISINTGGAGGTGAGDGGVFKSANQGDNWAQKVAIPGTTGEKRSISGVSVAAITQDPQDPNALYIGTAENGMFYSYDGGESWQQPAQLNRGRVSGIAVDSSDKCVIYATADNKLLKTEDCSRTWTVKYLDARVDKKTTAVIVDWFNPGIVWVANNSGDLLRSGDGGESWASVKNFDNNHVIELALSASDSRKLYVGTKTGGVWRTDDGGATWKDLRKSYETYPAATEFFDMALGVSAPNTVVLASKYGLLRSTDGGDNWESMDLLTPAGSTLIYSVAMDPKDPNRVYYGTSTTFYRTANGGANWVPKKLPTSRTATALIVDKLNSSVLYMGVTRFK